MIDRARYGTCTPAGRLPCGAAAVPVRVLRRQGHSAPYEDRPGRRIETAVDFVPGTHAGAERPVHPGVAIASIREDAA